MLAFSFIQISGEICSRACVQDMLKEMLEEMDEEDIPAEYGGKLDGDFYSSHQEKEFWSFVEQLGSSS